MLNLEHETSVALTNLFSQAVQRILYPTEKRIAITFDNFPDGLGDTSSSSWRYPEYVRYAYKLNPVVYACIREISTASKSVKFVIKRDGEVIPESDIPKDLMPIYRLITMPSPGDTMRAFIEMWTMHMNIGGCAFAHLEGFGTRPGLNGDVLKTAPSMRLLRPDKVRVVTNDYGHIQNFLYIPNGETIPPEEMIYTRYPDPDNMTGSFSPIAAAAEVIQSHTDSIRWNRNVLKRGGIPAILFFIKGLVNIKAEKRNELLDSYTAQFGGAKNAGRPMYLPGESVDVKEVSQSAKDVDWLAGKQDMMRDVCAVLGVPSKLIGDPAASTYNNVAEARKSFYIEKIIPDLQAFADSMTNAVASKKPGIEIGLEYSHIDVMQEDMTALFNRLAQASWLTQNEKRVQTGVDEVPGGDVILVPFNLAPLSEVGKDYTENTDEGMAAGRTGIVEKRDDTVALPHVDPRTRYPSEIERRAIYWQIDRKRVIWERKYKARMITVFKRQLSEVITALDEYDTAAAKDRRETRAIEPDMVARLFSETNQDEELAESVKTLQVGLMVEFGSDWIKRLKAEGILFDIERPDIQRWIAQNLAERSRLINQTTADRMQRIINAGVDENEGILKIQDRLRDAFPTLSNARSRAIAQTEVGRAAMEASLESFKQADVAMKEWLSARDDKVRDTHMDMDGQARGVDADFMSPSGASGPAPGQLGDAAEDINCRCVLVPLDTEDDAI